MSGVNEAIVREFFEARGFLVRQQRKYVASGLPADEIDFVVHNPRRLSAVTNLPFILDGPEVDQLGTAVVAVRGWHTETFSAALLAQEPASESGIGQGPRTDDLGSSGRSRRAAWNEQPHRHACFG